MVSKFRNIGLILVGAAAGILLSLNFQAIAERSARNPLPVEELRAFTEVFGAIKQNYVEPVEDKKLFTEAINGMLTGLDPHSAYLDADAFRDLQVGTQGQFGGLGIEVGMEDGFVKVISPIEDTPAFRAGIKPGDLIIKIDDTAVKGMTLNDAVKRMRGKPNTQITLTIARKGESAPIVVTLTRAIIRVQSVKSKVIEPGYAFVRISQFQERCGKQVIGNKAASGTEIIEELGPRQLETGELIVYTSVDSVFQVAAHTDKVSLDELYRCCTIAREILVGDWAIGRVIARPFIGEPGAFVRTADRKDFALAPPGRTVVDMVADREMEVISIGKVSNILGNRGFTDSVHTSSDQDGLEKTRSLFAKRFGGLVLVNLVDLDTLYGHRNNSQGYAQALEELDRHISRALEVRGVHDMIFLTADHGCDPTHPGTDHTREYVPLLVMGGLLRQGVNLGTRSTFADVAATISDHLRLDELESGVSFLSTILQEPAGT